MRLGLPRAADGPLRDFLAVPSPGAATQLNELGLLAVDFETTGLDPRADHIVAMGWVPVDGRVIRLGGARRLVVAARAAVGASATVHGITDDEVAGGVAPSVAVAELLAALRGRVLLAHYAAIETGFTDAATRALLGGRFRVPVVDTMVLQHRILGDAAQPAGLRLFNARRRFGLPRYRAHDPLLDALACAELYLAQTAELGVRTLRQIRC